MSAAEVWSISEEAEQPVERVRLGSTLAAFGKRFGGLELDISRDLTPSEPARFE